MFPVFSCVIYEIKYDRTYWCKKITIPLHCRIVIYNRENITGNSILLSSVASYGNEVWNERMYLVGEPLSSQPPKRSVSGLV